MDNEKLEGVIHGLNVLGASLTVARRNVQMMHWNYHDVDFITVHPWLDDVSTQLAEAIDGVYEQIKIFKGPTIGDLTSVVNLSKVETLTNDNMVNGTMSHLETFDKLRQDVEALKRVTMANALMANDNNLFGFHDKMVGILKCLDKLNYFITSSIIR